MSSREVARRAKAVEMLLLDVDGVMTDGGIFLSGRSEEAKRFDAQDGMGVTLARSAGLRVGILTGRSSAVVERRAEELKMDCVYQGHADKARALDIIAGENRVTSDQIAYVGDDILDLPVMRLDGLPLAVPNARPEVKAESA